MRYLLLFLLLAFQSIVYGYSTNNQQKTDVQKTLISVKSDLNARNYDTYRYYDPSSGTYISQDPIGLEGQMPNMYSYVHDLNAWIDPFGLDYFRGSKNGDLNFTPKPNEYKIDKSTGLVKNTHGVSVFDNTGSVTKNGFTPNKVDMSTVSDKLQIKQRGNDLKHFEIMPKNNMPLDEFKTELSKVKCA